MQLSSIIPVLYANVLKASKIQYEVKVIGYINLRFENTVWI